MEQQRREPGASRRRSNALNARRSAARSRTNRRLSARLRAEKRKAARQGGKTPKSAKKSKVAEPEPASDDDDSKPISRSASEADLSTKGQSWTAPEKKAFLAALAEHGKDFKAIANAVGSKSQTAAKAYFGKHKKSLGLEKIVKDHATAKAKEDKRKETKKGTGKGAAAKEEPAEKPATPAPDESGEAAGDAAAARCGPRLWLPISRPSPPAPRSPPLTRCSTTRCSRR